MYSNCLIEALKAKIKDPKNTRIIYLSPKNNKGNWHFFWIKNDTVHHYSDPNARNDPGLFFKGIYKESSLEAFEATFLKVNMMHYAYSDTNKIVEYAKKLKLPSTTKEGYLAWSRYWPEEGLLDKPVENKICKKVMIADKAKNNIQIVDIKDFDSKNFEYCDWKYLSPYCQEWLLLGRQ